MKPTILIATAALLLPTLAKAARLRLSHQMPGFGMMQLIIGAGLLARRRRVER
jgi:hypothetical protein